MTEMIKAAGEKLLEVHRDIIRNWDYKTSKKYYVDKYYNMIEMLKVMGIKYEEEKTYVGDEHKFTGILLNGILFKFEEV